MVRVVSSIPCCSLAEMMALMTSPAGECISIMSDMLRHSSSLTMVVFNLFRKWMFIIGGGDGGDERTGDDGCIGGMK